VQDASICTVANCRQCRLTGDEGKADQKKSWKKTDRYLVYLASSKGPVQAQIFELQFV